MSTNTISNERGVSLVGMMVIAGIGIIVMSGMTTMITDIFSAQRAMQSKDANREIVQAIRGYLSDPTACENSFASLGPITSPNVVQATSIKDKNNQIIYQKNTNYLNNLVKVTSLDLKNYDAAKGIIDLDITLDKVGSKIGGVQMLTKTQLQVTVDASTKIVKCHALGSADSLWQLNSNMTDIYYNGGKVGIGMTAPASPLHVTGGDASMASGTFTNTGTDAGKSYSGTSGILQVTTGGNGTPTTTPAYALNPVFRVGIGGGSTGSMTTEWFRVNLNGNVGVGTTSPARKFQVSGQDGQPTVLIGPVGDGLNIYQRIVDNVAALQSTMNDGSEGGYLSLQPNSGSVVIGSTTPSGAKLDVNGGIKPGSATTGLSCTPNPEGTFAYDPAAHAPVYCSNTGLWTTIGGAGGGVSVLSGNSLSCPAGMSSVTRYWNSRTCSGATSCTTTQRWYPDPPTCKYDNGNNNNLVTCLANSWAKIICQ